MLSEEIQKVIRPRGWSPDRKVTVEEWVSELEHAGCHISAEARKIWVNFGGLEVFPAKTPDDVYTPDSIQFDPVTDIVTEVGRIFFLEQHLGQRLTPIGMLHPSEAILVIGESGEVFSIWGNAYSEDGKTFEEALSSTLLFARRRPIVHVL